MKPSTIALIVLAVILAAIGQTWVLMLLFGAVHSFVPAVPAFGFWQVFLVTTLIGMIMQMFRAAA